MKQEVEHKNFTGIPHGVPQNTVSLQGDIYFFCRLKTQEQKLQNGN